MQESFENSVKNMLTIIGEDPNREGLVKTPERVYKAFKFLTSGYEQDPKEVLGDALFTSSNNEMVVGLSKIPRMVNIYARRLQIQEQMTEQIAKALEDVIAPKGVGVVVEARHMCVEMRGVEKINSTTTTSALRGCFIKNADTRREFFSLINSPRETHF